MKKYIPITQQRYCCVATCLQMILLRLGYELIPQNEEEIKKFLRKNLKNKNIITCFNYNKLYNFGNDGG